ncbi:prepilin-type N-terminal cleavage/methylation domain-containing protein [Prochlorococcus sp. MIT 0801]|uniref:prepilin-type N-terminal cleavage/methylation domain-containing protein n=1 Tax=Prochlorococcus sp. MIT 0801 TaxID=1501269 RepID=UPI0004F908B9|nr:prepilin-type N-terminal cleavage/methylation domain-containing protein [Prochlorococcus sp. MIT 0801]AIQ97338.1 hypothetical protein EW15_1246 [Prochlorococcus sp. MIT 0801]
MNLLQNYLSSSKVKKVLSLKPGQKGFSLIELVVVVAVLAVLSAIAIPQFTKIASKARAAAAATTLATTVKECAANMADQGSGTYIPSISLDGYRDGTKNGAGWYQTVFNNQGQGTLTRSTSVTPLTCTSSGLMEIRSENTAEYPSFVYNLGTGAKTCTASGDAVERGCRNSVW